jgi:hypothetical protein
MPPNRPEAIMSAIPFPVQPASGDPKQTELALGLLFQQGDTIEVRVPHAQGNSRRTDCGYFNDLQLAAKALFQADQQNMDPHNHAEGIYISLNPVDPALLSRACNRIKPWVTEATKKQDIPWRRHLLFDVDARRASGTSSNDHEHQAALDVARDIRMALQAEGWPECILADSGNAAHLIFAIDLAADVASEQLIKKVLQAAAARFNNAEVLIDEGVFDANRIFKISGTVARKGDHTQDRPHRMARILSHPVTLPIVPQSLLEDLAQQAPSPAGGSQQTAGGGAQQTPGGGAQGTPPLPFDVPLPGWQNIISLPAGRSRIRAATSGFSPAPLTQRT